MNKKEISINIYNILDTLVGTSVDITDDSDLEFDLMVDSLDKNEIVLEVERTFCIDISNAEMAELRTVKDIIVLVDMKINHTN